MGQSPRLLALQDVHGARQLHCQADCVGYLQVFAARQGTQPWIISVSLNEARSFVCVLYSLVFKSSESATSCNECCWMCSVLTVCW